MLGCIAATVKFKVRIRQSPHLHADLLSIKITTYSINRLMRHTKDMHVIKLKKSLILSPAQGCCEICCDVFDCTGALSQTLEAIYQSWEKLLAYN